MDRHEITRWRRVGYAVFPGDTFSYIVLTRPGQWPAILVQMLVGAALGATLGQGPLGNWLDAHVAEGAIVWASAGFGGTLALNSAFDHDIGDIGGLRLPPAAPRHLAQFGLALISVGGVAMAFLSDAALALYALCAMLSILYSVPPIRLKRIPGIDLVVNVVGFGFATPLAGWLLTGRRLTSIGLMAITGIALSMGALYPLTQLYQLAEDRARGDVTFARRVGVARSLQFALTMAVAATALIIGTLTLKVGLSAAILPTAAFAWWIVIIARWQRDGKQFTPSEHMRVLYRAGNVYVLALLAIIASCFAASLLPR